MANVNAEEATSLIVNRLILDWVSLRIAIEQGLGGPDGPLKHKWMAQVVADFLNKEKDLDPTDVEDYIAEILFNEFDTVIEDGTLPQISALMLQLQKLCRQGRVEEALDQLPKERPSIPHVQAEPETQLREEDMIDEEDVDDVARQVESLSSGEPRRRNNEPDEDGWITVGKSSSTNSHSMKSNGNTTTLLEDTAR